MPIAARPTEPAATRPAQVASARRPRVGWVDAAKGLCILLVVLGHAITEMEAHGYSTSVWPQLNFFLGPIRMPLFFLLSGLFAAKALSESWHKLANRRIWVMVYLYVLWVPLRDLVLFALPYTRVDSEAETLPAPILELANWPSRIYNTAHALVEPTSYLWFLWALALFAIISRALRSVPAVIQLVAAAAINVWSPFSGVSWAWDFISQMAFFYLFGLHCGPWIFRMVERRNYAFLGLTLGSFLLGALWVQLSFPSFNEGNTGFTRLFLATTGALGAINLMALVQHTRLVAPFEKVGRRTLPIFLMHIPMLVVLLIVADFFLPADPQLFLMTPLVTAIAALACLGLHRALLAMGAQWLFVRPAWVVRLTTPGQSVFSATVTK